MTRRLSSSSAVVGRRRLVGKVARDEGEGRGQGEGVVPLKGDGGSWGSERCARIGPPPDRYCYCCCYCCYCAGLEGEGCPGAPRVELSARMELRDFGLGCSLTRGTRVLPR